MAYLDEANKEDLLTLATELAVKVSTGLTMMELKQCIIESNNYDEEFTMELLNSITEEREEEVKRRKEDEDRELELQTLRLEVAQRKQKVYSTNNFCSSSPMCYDSGWTNGSLACSKKAAQCTEARSKHLQKESGDKSFQNMDFSATVSSSNDSFHLRVHVNEDQNLLLAKQTEMELQNAERMHTSCNNDKQNMSILWDTNPKCYACGEEGYVRSQCPVCYSLVSNEIAAIDCFDAFYETNGNTDDSSCSSLSEYTEKQDGATVKDTIICKASVDEPMNTVSMDEETEIRTIPSPDGESKNQDRINEDTSNSHVFENEASNCFDVSIETNINVNNEKISCSLPAEYVEPNGTDVDDTTTDMHSVVLQIGVAESIFDEKETEIGLKSFQNVDINYKGVTVDVESNLHVCRNEFFAATVPNEPDSLLGSYQRICHPGGDAENNIHLVDTEVDLSDFMQVKYLSAGVDKVLTQDMIVDTDGGMTKENKAVLEAKSLEVFKPDKNVLHSYGHKKLDVTTALNYLVDILWHRATDNSCTSSTDETSGFQYVNVYPPERDKTTSPISQRFLRVSTVLQMKKISTVSTPIALWRRRGRPPRVLSASLSGRLQNPRGSM